MRLSSDEYEYGHEDGSSFDTDEKSYDSDEKYMIKRSVCSDINISALITMKTAINRAIAGKW